MTADNDHQALQARRALRSRLDCLGIEPRGLRLRPAAESWHVLIGCRADASRHHLEVPTRVLADAGLDADPADRRTVAAELDEHLCECVRRTAAPHPHSSRA